MGSTLRWRKEEESGAIALLAIWGEDSIQRQLLGSVRNVVPYRAVAEALRRQGYDLDFEQCREKIKGLKKKYKETVDSLRRSGEGVESDEDLDELDISVSFKWFAEIHGVLGRRAVVNPPSLIDSSDFASERSGTSTPTVDDPGQSSSADQAVTLPPTSTAERAQLMTPAATDSVDQIRPRTPATDGGDQPVTDEQASTSLIRPRTPAVDGDQPGPSSAAAGRSTTQPRTKKRKLTKTDKMDKSNKAMMDTFLAAQEESRQEVIELERQRMAWDRQQAQEANEKEERWMTFMRDMFSMFAAPPMP